MEVSRYGFGLAVFHRILKRLGPEEVPFGQYREERRIALHGDSFDSCHMSCLIKVQSFLKLGLDST